MYKIDDNKTDHICLEIKDAAYYYEGEALPVWEHLSCRFYEGKINAIIGPSGCGKSSILYLLNGLIPHMYEGKLEGGVYFQGEDWTSLMPRYRCETIGLVMQNPESQFCTFTVEEELAFGMENLGFDTETMSSNIKSILEFVGMSGYEEYNLDNLSGGQKQKIAIASILVTNPKILLLDEPTANLDPVSRKQIFDLIVRLSSEKDITVIIVEHNIEEIMSNVDYVLALDKNGVPVYNGSRALAPGDLRSSPAANKPPFSAHKNLADSKKVLEIKDLDFSYPDSPDGKKIIDHLDLDIYQQDFLAIVGNNGVGKTTLMKLIFRICSPTYGSIHLYGKPVESYRKKDLYHMIGLVFQNPENQFIKNTVYDELMFSLKRVKIKAEEKEDKVQDMLQRFHLEKEKNKSPFILSQGQKRRLSVAEMLLTNQQILFLDEPTYGQDFENRQELMKDLKKLCQEGITIVMITHDLELVKQYATRVVRLESGKNICDLSTQEYFSDSREKGGAADVRIR